VEQNYGVLKFLSKMEKNNLKTKTSDQKAIMQKNRTTQKYLKRGRKIFENKQ
jgi:hypothetical protein